MKSFFSLLRKPKNLGFLFLSLVLGTGVLVSSCQKSKRKVIPIKGTFTIVFGENGHHTGYGNASYIGSFKFESVDNEDNFPSITGTSTFTAENGDQIFVTHTANAVILPDGKVKADFENTITGGTGNFNGAKGRFITSIVVDDSKPQADGGTIEGVIIL